MNKLVDIDNNLITREISNVLVSFDTLKIKNRLLDGTYHIQTVGEPIKVIIISCNMQEEGKLRIDDAYNIDKPIKLNWYGKYYIGLISDPPSMSIFLKGSDAKRRHAGDIKIMISSEGVI
ncbi:MAG: hypothetical protein RBR71_03485 [Gudongella sp.]|nr:hypothetical protein [Gudongella sp.]